MEMNLNRDTTTYDIGYDSASDSEGAGLPLFSSLVTAGFPSPADDYIDRRLDLNELLVAHPAATFFVRVAGDSMIGAGIHHGDLLVVDRSVAPSDGNVVIAVVDDELTVKRLSVGAGGIALVPENPDYEPIVIGDPANLIVWGVVTAVVHTLR